MNCNRRSAILSAISGCLASLLPWKLKPKEPASPAEDSFIACHYEYQNGVKHYFANKRCGTRLELNENQYWLIHNHLSSGIAGAPYWWADCLGSAGIGLLGGDGYVTASA